MQEGRPLIPEIWDLIFEGLPYRTRLQAMLTCQAWKSSITPPSKADYVDRKLKRKRQLQAFRPNKKRISKNRMVLEGVGVVETMTRYGFKEVCIRTPTSIFSYIYRSEYDDSVDLFFDGPSVSVTNYEYEGMTFAVDGVEQDYPSYLYSNTTYYDQSYRFEVPTLKEEAECADIFNQELEPIRYLCWFFFTIDWKSS
jgi:hypothetical protein